MTNLVLELRQGDMMVVNGAAIRFRNRTRIELTAHARFLFGRQIMPPQEADTPAKRIYFALQTAYIGDEEERRHGLSDADILIGDFIAATTSETAKDLLRAALACARADKCYEALRLARRVVRHEAACLATAGAAADPAAGKAAPVKHAESGKHTESGKHADLGKHLESGKEREHGGGRAAAAVGVGI